MEEIHQKALRKTRVLLVDKLDIDEILPALAEKDVFTENMIERIREQGARSSQVQKLMTDLPRRGKHAYRSFLECLDSTGHRFLADEIRKKACELEGSSTSTFSGVTSGNANPPGSLSASEPMDQSPDYLASTRRGHDVAQPMADNINGASGSADSLPYGVPETAGLIHPIVQPSDANEMEQSDNSLNAYKMTSKPRGYCLIINNRFFNGFLKERAGTDVDKENLKYIFCQLQYLVDTKDNLTRDRMKTILHEFSQYKEHDNVDSCVVILLTHGLEGKIYGTDCELLNLGDVFTMFDGHNCQALKGKPKLFIVQACRGERQDPGFDLTDGQRKTWQSKECEDTGARDWQNLISTLEETDGTRLPTGADFLISYATIPGYVSWRNSSQGSWFVQALVEVFAGEAFHDDVLSMLVKVNNKVATVFESGSRCKQIPAPVVLLRKKWFFYPGV